MINRTYRCHHCGNHVYFAWQHGWRHCNVIAGHTATPWVEPVLKQATRAEILEWAENHGAPLSSGTRGTRASMIRTIQILLDKK